MNTRNRRAGALIVAAWAMYLIALFLPAVDVDMPMAARMELHGWEATVFSLALIQGFLESPSMVGLLYLVIPLGNVALFLCPLELLVHHHLRRMAVPVTVVSAAALACVVLLPTFEGSLFAGRHSGHYLMLAAMALLAFANIELMRERA